MILSTVVALEAFDYQTILDLSIHIVSQMNSEAHKYVLMKIRSIFKCIWRNRNKQNIKIETLV